MIWARINKTLSKTCAISEERLFPNCIVFGWTARILISVSFRNVFISEKFVGPCVKAKGEEISLASNSFISPGLELNKTASMTNSLSGLIFDIFS